MPKELDGKCPKCVVEEERVAAEAAQFKRTLARIAAASLALLVAALAYGWLRAHHQAQTRRQALEQVRLVAFGERNDPVLRPLEGFFRQHGLSLHFRAPDDNDPLWRELRARFTARPPVLVVGQAIMSRHSLDDDGVDKKLDRVLRFEQSMQLQGRKERQLCRYHDCDEMAGVPAPLAEPFYLAVVMAIALLVSLGGVAFLTLELRGRSRAIPIVAWLVLSVPAFAVEDVVVSLLGQSALILFGVVCVVLRRIRRAVG